MSLVRNIGGVTAQNNSMTDAETILAAVSQPGAIPPGPATTPPIFTPVTINATDSVAASNSTDISQIVAGVPNTLLYAGLGAGALWLAMRKGKGVGSAEGKKKSMLPLLLIGGGVLVYWLYTKNQTAVPVTADLGEGIPDPGTATTAVTTATVPVAAMLNPAPVLPSDTNIYNALYGYSIPWRYAIDRMSIAERQALYTYVFGYIKKALRLYNYAGSFPDGFFDLSLYQQIKTLSDKWNLMLLN